jgi:hypothetical protein
MPKKLVFTTVLQRLSGVPVVLDPHDLMVERFAYNWSGFGFHLLAPVPRGGDDFALL